MFHKINLSFYYIILKTKDCMYQLEPSQFSFYQVPTIYVLEQNKTNHNVNYLLECIMCIRIYFCFLLEINQTLLEPHCEKTCLRVFRPGPTKTGLYSHSRWLEA